MPSLLDKRAVRPSQTAPMWAPALRSMPARPPGPLFHATILCCQTGGLAFGVRAYRMEGEKDRARQAELAKVEEARRVEAEAMHALDRTAAYFNARRPERLVLELEMYRTRMQRVGWARRWLITDEDAQGWADRWLEQRGRLDAQAMQMEAHRVELKNLWYLASQAWRQHPAQRAHMNDFYHDAPLRPAFAMRCLRVLEPMDKARFKRRGREYERPTIYPFIASLYRDSRAGGRCDGQCARGGSQARSAVGRGLRDAVWASGST